MADATEIGVADLVAARAEDDDVALLAGDSTWTWREVVAEASTRAAWLTSTLDPSHPPNVGVLLDNTPDFVFTLFGAALAGACVVGINSTRRGAELQRDIDHTDCQLVLTDKRLAELLQCEHVLVEDEPWKAHAGAALPAQLPDPSSLLLLIFTSGSTSAPKAVRRSSGRIAAAANLGFPKTDTLYISMPLIHGNALFGALFPALTAGARIALRDRFSARGWLDDVRRYEANFTTTVGRALSYLLATPPRPEDRDHQLRIVLAPESSPRDAADFTERFGVPVVTGYGQSEGGITLLPSRRHGALGRAPEGSDVAVVDQVTGEEKPRAVIDDNGLLLNADEAIGELVRRDSAGAFEGYWANDEADATRLHDGWYWSGDLAYRDADGVFFFAGRAGDWIRVDSENFASAPIERIIDRHPDVAAVAVVGVADPHDGDQVLAAIQLVADATFDPHAFAAWLAQQADLGTKWSPTFVRVSDALPNVAHDKIDRQRLKREAWATTDPVWWRRDRRGDFQVLTDAHRDAMYAEFVANDRISLAPAKAAGSRRRKALAAGFTAWFAARDGVAPIVSIERPQPGLSSDTLLLTVGDASGEPQGYVARLPPHGPGLFPDYDLERQAAVQQAVSAAGIPAAPPVAMETDPKWVGSPFLLMPRVFGRTLTTNPPYLTHGWLAEASAAKQEEMFRRFIDVLADIHQLDPAGIPATGGGPTLEGIIDYWERYLDWATDDAAGALVYRDAISWCRNNLPSDPPPATLLWGDPQLTNLVVDDSGEVAAVLDWEMSGVGPAELDLSWFLVLHEHAAETAGAELPGYPGRATIVDWYETASGRRVADLHFYDVLANLRSGAIVQRIGAIMSAAGHSASWTAHVPQPRHLARLIGAQPS
ncbi:MAG TPA: AMP-binding protein [Mycobacteriales bacterium]|nr:AMP-binding protein [Mycobacteriales bacterium]